MRTTRAHTRTQVTTATLLRELHMVTKVGMMPSFEDAGARSGYIERRMVTARSAQERPTSIRNHEQNQSRRNL
jgi:hypothetical protein